jgi:hypothetical protein
MLSTASSPRSNSRTRRRIAGLIVAGASALTVAGLPQAAHAQTSVAEGNPGTFTYASWHHNMLAVGEAQTATGSIATFHSDGPIVEPNAATQQYVVANYSLEYKPPYQAGHFPSWEEVANSSEIKNMASFAKGGAPGTQMLDDVDFAPDNPQPGRYRVEVEISWFSGDPSVGGSLTGVQRAVADPMDGRLACVAPQHAFCSVDADVITLSGTE